MKKFYSRIVGNRHRLAGSLVLPVLEIGQPLLLDPEPENEFDALAVKVNVDLTGSKYVNNPDLDADGPIICLGYIPRSGTRTDTTGFGNKEVLNIIGHSANWVAYLDFSPQGDALVCIEVHPIAKDGKVVEDEEHKRSWHEGKYKLRREAAHSPH